MAYLYERDEFYIEDYFDLPDRIKVLFRKFFKLSEDDIIESFDLYEYVMQAIENKKINHIYEFINMFFMFQEQYQVIEERLLLRNKAGEIIEKPYQMADRLANYLATAEPLDSRYGIEKMNKWYSVFLEKLLNFEVSPNTPAWSSAGVPGFGCFACAVVGNGDSLEEIAKWYRDTLFMNRYGFGIGHSLHKIRPKDSPFAQSRNKTKSSLKWLNVIDDLSVSMSQGMTGREGANMVTIPIWHPDVLEFIEVKNYPEMPAWFSEKLAKKYTVNDLVKFIVTSNSLPPDAKEIVIAILEESIPIKRFNLSVVVDDEFMRRAVNGEEYTLKFDLPDHSFKVRKKVNAGELLDKIAYNAWYRGDPGLLFFDAMNRDNHFKNVKGYYMTTNPCFPYDELVLTNEGFKKIGDIVENKMDVDILTAKKQVLRKPSKFYNNGIQDVYEIKTEHGLIIRATKDQEFFVFNKDTQQEELVKLEDLQVETHRLIVNEKPLIYTYDAEYYLGRAIGHLWEKMIIKDSPVRDNCYRVEVEIVPDGIEVELRHDLIKSLHALNFNVEINFLKGINRDVLTMDIDRAYIDMELDRLSISFMAGFLRGIFSQLGYFPTYYNTRKTYEVTIRVSTKIARRIQLMLTAFGILSKVKHENQWADVSTVAIQGHRILKFFEVIGIENEKRAIAIRSMFLKIVNRSTNRTKIVSIEKVGSEVVYDLYIDGDPTFIVGGVKAKDCGEIPLHEYSICNLWTINLMKHINFYHKKINWGKLRDTIRVVVRMADDLVTVNYYPREVPELEKSEKEERRIGIDITGLADLYFVLGIRYGNDDAIDLLKQIRKYIRDIAREYSVKLGRKKGSFALLKKSEIYWDSEFKVPDECPACGGKIEKFEYFIQCENCMWAKYKYLRNSYLFTQAPTGSRSRKLGVSFGIEPYFELFYVSRVMNKEFRTAQRIPEWYARLMAREKGINYWEIKESDLPNFVVSHEISPMEHLMVQVVCQQYVEQSVSKTVNLPEDATVEDVREIYIRAWQLGCKGITIYRSGSHLREVISDVKECPQCGSSDLLFVEGCYTCKKCGASGCLL